MEIFGAYPPKKSHVETLILSIEMSLQKVIIEKLAGSLLKFNGSLS